MKTEKPTPIPRRASTRKDPKPIEFPAHSEPRTANLALPERLKPHLRMDLDTGEVVSRMDEARLRALVSQCVHEALRKHDRLLIHTFYKVVMDWPLAEIVTMGEAEFEARCCSILEDAE
ncbi:MAG TPA: hypothetical protein VFK47_14750 [Ktedonobacteraceae bacterium]|nr:hypothetical protein [Ktedonobacteraceae bacterium]